MGQNRVSSRAPKFVVAILLAVIAAAVYHAFVFSEFEPIRTEAVTTRLQASGHRITVKLPELSRFRGQTAVLVLRLQNTLLAQRNISVTGGGLPKRDLSLPPSRTVRVDIVVPPDAVETLSAADDAARTLEIAGDSDDWAVTGVEIRNHYVSAGQPPMVVAVPADSEAHNPVTGFFGVAAVLCLLVIVSAVTPAATNRLLRLTGSGAALAAFVASLACLLLPRVSPYKVLISLPVFLVLAVGLFAPAVLYAAIRAPSLCKALLTSDAAVFIFGRVAAYWKPHQVTFERGAALLGLTAIAIAQPVFEVISNSPEFFAARGTTPATAVTGVLAICLGIPLLLLTIERALRLISRRAAAAFYMAALAVLAAAVVSPWLRRTMSPAAPWDIVIAACAGIALAASSASRMGRQFLTALGPAALVVPALFFFNPAVMQSLMPSESAAGVQSVERKPSIVFVIFDELPLVSLLGADGEIDAGRYPSFAALARDAYWFREASTVASNTSHAVPAILSGRYPTAIDDLPTLRYYPVNLFTTLARHYQIVASLRFQQLCPARACEDSSSMTADSVDALLSDLSVVWLHIVLPERLTEGLPAVTEDWAEFGRTAEAPGGQIPAGRGGVFAQFLSAIDGTPGRLHFIHSMLPHMPLEYVPTGRRYRRPENENQLFRHDRLFEGATAEYADTVHQRHLAQAGFVDHLVGDLLARLREVGLYDEALVVITADHGASYREGRLRRQPQESRNLSDIFRVPLFIKLPGQQRGETVDRIAETVDILPTVLDVIGAKTSIRFDGRSLVDSQLPPRASRTFVWRNRQNVDVRQFGGLTAERADSLERKERRFGRGDQAGLYAIPDARQWLGLAANRVPAHRVEGVQVTIRNARQFQGVNLERDPLPLYVNGVLDTADRGSLPVVVAVNGIVAAVTRSYLHRGSQIFGTLIPETSLRDGNNDVTAFVVETASRSN